MSAAAFIVALLTLILIPRQATRTAALLLEGTTDRPDTVALARSVDRAQLAVQSSELILARHKARARERQLHAPDSLANPLASGPPTNHRDSVAAQLLELNRLLAHAEHSPLTTSYRALGAATALRGDPRVGVLLDSLSDVERARTAFDAAGGVDPIFVALTARLNAIGRALQRIADGKRAALRTQLTAISGPPPSATPIAAADTVGPLAHVDSARRAFSAATRALDSARATDAALDSRAEQAREIANASAPPIALMGAALVLGVAVGFAVTFGFELRTPRVADAAEAERVSGVPTLVIVGPHTPDPQRARRSADRTLSPLVELNSERYRYVYQRTTTGSPPPTLGFPLLVVTGDEAELVATVATNVAIAAVHESRSALLIDADIDAAMVAPIVQVAAAPGVADVLAGRLDWTTAIVSAHVGRDRGLDVIPAGNPTRRRTPFDTASMVLASATARARVAVSGEPAGIEIPDAKTSSAPTPTTAPLQATTPAAVDSAELRAELLRVARRYDLVVVAAPAGAVPPGSHSVLPLTDTIVCARLAYTTLTRLATFATAARDAGMRVRGTVLWDADVPPRAPDSP